VIARTLEEAGLVTVSISQVREHSAKILPPRALWVPFPFGLPLGHAGDVEQQRRVLACAFDLLLEPSGPVLRDLAGDEDDEERGAPVQASDVAQTGTAPQDVAMELLLMRQHHERWQGRGGRTTVGLTRIPPRRFRGVVRFLEAFADGSDADMAERPADVEPQLWIRWCVDDLKALYVEGRLSMVPEETADAAARWLWGETALGDLIRRVARRMESSADPPMRAAAYGIAR
jgi:hypothetical protein